MLDGLGLTASAQFVSLLEDVFFEDG